MRGGGHGREHYGGMVETAGVQGMRGEVVWGYGVGRDWVWWGGGVERYHRFRIGAFSQRLPARVLATEEQRFLIVAQRTTPISVSCQVYSSVIGFAACRACGTRWRMASEDAGSSTASHNRGRNGDTGPALGIRHSVRRLRLPDVGILSYGCHGHTSLQRRSQTREQQILRQKWAHGSSSL